MKSEQFSKYRFILASKSPRRQQLLSELGLDFELITREVEESYPEHLEREQIALYLSRKKAIAFEDILVDNNVVITADTIVCIEKKVIGKPADYNDAVSILNQLSGRMHEVFTGCCVSTKEKKEIFFVRTEVYFKALSSSEIEYYLKNYKPFDKAGAYGIQDWIGLIGIEKIVGSFHNVMGLPVKELYEHLQKL